MINNQERKQGIFQSWGEWLENFYFTILNIMKILVLLSFTISNLNGLSCWIIWENRQPLLKQTTPKSGCHNQNMENSGDL